MKTENVGKKEAGSTTLIKIIFEVNLRLYSNQPRKKVLFVLRDFSPEDDNADSFIRNFTNDISEIWKKIKKPDELINTIAEDFFDFEFLLMPHKIYLPQKFNDEVTKLRRRFDRSASNSLFLRDFHQKDIPIDGLSAFISHVWDTI